MKTHFKSFIATFFLIAILSAGVSAAEKQKSQVVSIQTSAICGSCKARLEKALKSTEGVEEALLNLNNKKVKVKYDPAKTNPDKIREVISGVGYDADDVKKKEDAFSKLPLCCQTPMEGDRH